MAADNVQLYNSGYTTIFTESNRQWDDQTPGNIYWILAGSGYTPDEIHSTTADLDPFTIEGGDGAPIAADNLVVTAAPGVATETFFQAGANATAGVVSFGSNVTVTAQYLICAQPTVAGTHSATTDKLIFYIDLTTASGDLTSTNGEFTINMPTNGWFKVSQA